MAFAQSNSIAGRFAWSTGIRCAALALGAAICVASMLTAEERAPPAAKKPDDKKPAEKKTEEKKTEEKKPEEKKKPKPPREVLAKTQALLIVRRTRLAIEIEQIKRDLRDPSYRVPTPAFRLSDDKRLIFELEWNQRQLGKE